MRSPRCDSALTNGNPSAEPVLPYALLMVPDNFVNPLLAKIVDAGQIDQQAEAAIKHLPRNLWRIGDPAAAFRRVRPRAGRRRDPRRSDGRPVRCHRASADLAGSGAVGGIP